MRRPEAAAPLSGVADRRFKSTVDLTDGEREAFARKRVFHCHPLTLNGLCRLNVCGATASAGERRGGLDAPTGHVTPKEECERNDRKDDENCDEHVSSPCRGY
jgi:hypothetical protein